MALNSDFQAEKNELNSAPDKIDIKDIEESLQVFGFAPDNSIVIGSGILSALDIRKSNDIDMLTTKEKYKELSESNSFEKKENHGREVLSTDSLEVMTNWIISGKEWNFDNLLAESVIVDGVRYVKLQFLLGVKKAWVAEDVQPRQKDIDDIKLMENYEKRNSKPR